MKNGTVSNADFDQLLKAAELLCEFVDQREERGLTIENDTAASYAASIALLLFDFLYETKDEQQRQVKRAGEVKASPIFMQ